MGNDRPSLNLKHVKDICPDKNGTRSTYSSMDEEWHVGIIWVPVIAIYLEDEVACIFKERYLASTLHTVWLQIEDFLNGYDELC
jgi:hypothetical protein